MSALTLYRLGLVVADLKHSLANMQKEQRLPQNADDPDRERRFAYNEGLIYAYSRSVNEIEDALEVSA